MYSRAASSRVSLDDNSLVDPASSHMLVSKTKPCMSKSKLCSVGASLQTRRNRGRLIKSVVVLRG